ncbi:uracil-DNA glycosylase [Chelatococcus composti]|jgi:Uracil-DNA glycosylase|uniref:Type-5 uracil-DNA glycosylase n=1 Tax=Chelatococcus composti TaxID=1743235 RepID=A0A841KFJ9_9HYPH|nr:uracil-DNA glycosylase [Chelatococcus composti]MBB6168193.1 uracil-DNA glycosylase family 4 [Chelatococcus composti]MBS7736721.1 uracil-DNA glycosylase [Chelatococcus composti]PZN37865.1 MAG: uracil-DNA glycosylase [Pseudomonadota bacterium]GGG38157.1 uracil-DNA glycosylase [Chelatococcus composti]
MIEPSSDCPRCPRLVAFRDEWRAREPHWHNAPVPSFGDMEARLLIVGLAPGLRGANRTGRPFTGDYAGDLLYETLSDFGFSSGVFAARPDDGLRLEGALLTNAVRCVPPENKPTGSEIATCRNYLAATIASLPRLRAILVLGRIAHDSTVRALGASPARVPFTHGAAHDIGRVRLFDSYHCSRYNTNTGRLTRDMFRAVFTDMKAYLDAL